MSAVQTCIQSIVGLNFVELYEISYEIISSVVFIYAINFIFLMQMHYQACMLERYHWSLDQKRKTIATEFSDKISQSCLLLDGKKLAKKIVELQSSAVEELTRLNEEEERANVSS